MDSELQRYYDTLKGKDYYSQISKYSSCIENVKARIAEVESLLNSSTWQEKGLESVKGTIISNINEQINSLYSGINALSTAATKIVDLYNKLEELRVDYINYNNAPDEQKGIYVSKINALQPVIVSLISEINGISYEFDDSKYKTIYVPNI